MYKMNIKDLLFFEKMITPQIVVVLYWLSLVAIVISGIGAMFSGQFLQGLGILILGAIAARIYCEFITVIFQLNKNCLLYTSPSPRDRG